MSDIQQLLDRIVKLEAQVVSLETSKSKRKVPKAKVEKTEKCEKCGKLFSVVGMKRHKGCNGFVQPSKDVVVKALKKKVEIDKKNDSE